MGTFRQTVTRAESEELRIQARKPRASRDDPWEREAEELSEWLARRKEGEVPAVAPPITPVRPTSPWGSEINRQLAGNIKSHPGKPLDPALRKDFESALQRDLGQVRIHDDAKAQRLARSLGAEAFASGQDIFTTSTDRSLLAHEVVHTVQQKDAPRQGEENIQGAFTKLTGELNDKVGILLLRHLRDKGPELSAVADELNAPGSWFNIMRGDWERAEEDDPVPTHDFDAMASRAIEAVNAYADSDTAAGSPIRNGVAAVLADYFRMNDAPIPAARLVLAFPFSMTLARSAATASQLSEEATVASAVSIAVSSAWTSGRPSRDTDSNWADEIVNVLDQFMGIAPLPGNLARRERLIARLETPLRELTVEFVPSTTSIFDEIEENDRPQMNELIAAARTALRDIRGHSAQRLQGILDFEAEHDLSPFRYWRLVVANLRIFKDSLGGSEDSLLKELRRRGRDEELEAFEREIFAMRRRIMRHVQDLLADKFSPVLESREGFWRRIRRIAENDLDTGPDADLMERAGEVGIEEALFHENERSLLREVSDLIPPLALALDDYYDLRQGQIPAPGMRHDLFEPFSNHNVLALGLIEMLEHETIPPVVALIEVAMAAEDSEAVDRFTWFAQEIQAAVNTLTEVSDTPIDENDESQLREHFNARANIAAHFVNLASSALTRFRNEEGEVQQTTPTSEIPGGSAWERIEEISLKAYRMEYLETSALFVPHPFEESSDSTPARIADDGGSRPISGLEPLNAHQLAEFYQRIYLNNLARNLREANAGAEQAATGGHERGSDDLWLVDDAVRELEDAPAWTRPRRFASRGVQWNPYRNDEPNAFGVILEKSRQFRDWIREWESSSGELPLVSFKSEGGPGASGEAWVWSLPTPVDLALRLFSIPLLRGLVAEDDADFSAEVGRLAELGDQAIARIPDPATEERRLASRQRATARGYNALLRRFRRTGEETAAPGRNEAWEKYALAQDRAKRLRDATGRFVLTSDPVERARRERIGPEIRAEMEAAENEANWEMRRATTLDRAIVRDLTMPLLERAGEEKISGMPALGYALRNIETFSRAVAPGIPLERRLQTSALILEVLDPLLTVIGDFGSIGSYENDAFFYLSQAKDSLDNLIVPEPEHDEDETPAIETHSRGIQWVTEDVRSEVDSQREDRRSRIQDVLDISESRLTDFRWQLSIAGNKDEKLLYSHVLDSPSEVETAPLIQARNADPNTNDPEPDYIDLGGGIRVRITHIHRDFTYLPGFGDTARARRAESSDYARYLEGEVYLGVTANSPDELEGYDPATVEDPDGNPSVQEGASTDPLVDVEVLHGDEVLSEFTIHAHQIGQRNSELNWLATVIHQKAVGDHWHALGVVLEGYGNLLLTIASLYPPVGMALAAVEILSFWNEMKNNPEFRAQLERIINEPVDTLTHFASAMTEHFSISGVFEIAMNSHFDAPAFAQRSPRQNAGRPMGGRKVARFFTRLKRIAAVMAVRLERYQEAVQGPIHRVEGELAEHPRLAAITNWAGEHVEDLSDPMSLLLRHPVAGPVYEAYALYRQMGSGEDASIFASIHEPVGTMARGIENGLEKMKNFEVPETILPLRFVMDAGIELMLALLRRGRGRVRVAGYLADLIKEGSDTLGTTDPLLRALEERIRGTWQDPNRWWADHIVPLLAPPIEGAIQSGGNQITDLLLQVPLLQDYLGQDQFAGRADALENTVSPPQGDASGVSAVANSELDELFESNRVHELIPDEPIEEEVGTPSRGQIAGLPDAFFEGMRRRREESGENESTPSAQDTGPEVSPRLAPERDSGLLSSIPSENTGGIQNSGETMDPAIKQGAERRFGHPFGGVRLHRGADAAALTAMHGAEALTSENHIFLRPGVSERSHHGSRVLDHELAHVLQKRGRQNGVRPQGSGLRLRRDEEQAADHMAERARSNTDNSLVPIEGAHHGGTSPSVRSELIEMFLRKISSPGSAASLAASVERAHQRGSVADLEENVQVAARQLWNIVGGKISRGNFTVPSYFNGSKNEIKNHVEARLSTLPEVQPAVQRSVPAASQVIDHLAVRRQSPVNSRRGATSANPPANTNTGRQQKLEATGFLDDLALYIAARSGIVFEFSGAGSLDSAMQRNPRNNARIEVEVKHIELYFIDERGQSTSPALALWTTAINNTWNTPGNLNAYRRGVRGTLKEHFRTDPPATTTSGGTAGGNEGETATGSESDDGQLMRGGFTPIWDRTGTSDLKFKDTFKDEVDTFMNPPQLDHTVIPPWPIYVGVEHNGMGSNRYQSLRGSESRTRANNDMSGMTTFSDQAKRTRASQIGIHFSTHADLTGGNWNLDDNNRNSHHIVQYLLPEYFHNDKAFKPFPDAGTHRYPGVTAPGGKVEEIENLNTGNSSDTIKVAETNSGRGGVMPAILLSARAHQNSDLHVTPQPDDTGSSSQGYAIHRKFEDFLKAEAGGTGSNASVANAYSYLRSNSDSATASAKLHNAIKKTYQWLWEIEMRDNLINDMPEVETDYYFSQFRDTPATDGNPGSGTTRRDALESIHRGNRPDESDVERAIRQVARSAEEFATTTLAAKGWKLPQG